ncbi:MAG: hypothetical protein OJJ21_22315 [Ferrovibrio sp.]|uniref:hypothetical protein n=1 Tax=Ferrovibrio sp. TaxID=1917215 RepID=UPI002634251C|nr:hypothetical protein [Ferrovibrio sp.]MCW0236349.1 hypothetical protein [Ferrovibrio sp.]
MATAAAAPAAQFDFDDAKSFDDNLHAFFDSLEAEDGNLSAALRVTLGNARRDGDDRREEIWDALLAMLAEAPKS